MNDIMDACSAIRADDETGLETVLNRVPGIIDQSVLGRSTLATIAAENGSTKALGVLIRYGADIDPSSNQVNSPLYGACHKRQLKAARFLLENGVSIDGKNCPQPILGAINSQDPQMVKFLLDRGAKVAFTFGELNYTPITYARSRGSEFLEIVEILEARDES